MYKSTIITFLIVIMTSSYLCADVADYRKAMEIGGLPALLNELSKRMGHQKVDIFSENSYAIGRLTTEEENFKNREFGLKVLLALKEISMEIKDSETKKSLDRISEIKYLYEIFSDSNSVGSFVVANTISSIVVENLLMKINLLRVRRTHIKTKKS